MAYNSLDIIQEKWSSLFSGMYQEKIRTPECQRILNIDNLNSIIQHQETMFLKYKTYKFIGAITFCLFCDHYYLVDGQHRYHAMKQLFDKYSHDYSCWIEVIRVESLDDLKSVYEVINKNTPLPEFNLSLAVGDKSILQETLHYYQDRYPQIWSKSIRARRPFIYFNSFQETLSFILQYIQVESSKQLIEIIDQYNMSLRKSPLSSYKNVNEKMMEKAKQWDFYLGLYTFDMNEDYGYPWARSIVEYHCPGIKLTKSKQGVKKKTISKSLRSKVWNRYIGQSIGETKCIVCQNCIINMMDFECGHIEAESKGGKTEVDNLLPICGLCNKSMGSVHMEEYVSSQFPGNVKRFRERHYEIKKEKKSFILF